MTQLTVDQQLPEYTVNAKNFARDSDNKIHDDKVAAEYGYRGGLVPGVAVYAYMTVPVACALGRDWLERGDMTGKFIKPIYDEEPVIVKARVAETDPIRIVVTAENTAGELCGVGEASYSDPAPPFDLTKYTLAPPPAKEDRLAPSIDVIKEGTPLGALTMRWSHEELTVPFLDDVVESLPLYREPGVTWHPAFMPHIANTLLVENIALGPWIHTASDVDHYALPEEGEEVVVRGRISHAYAKRGHEIVVADIAFTGRNDRILALMAHSAIVKPAKKS